MEALFKEIRANCTASTWSKGVELARANLVTGIANRDGEIELRVCPQGTAVGITVYLYVDDEDWSCECPHREDVCSHTVGAVIAMRQAKKDGQGLPAPKYALSAQLHYRLNGQANHLRCERWLVSEEGERSLSGSLIAYVERGEQPLVAPSQNDLQIDRILNSAPANTPPRHMLTDLLHLLDECEHVFFNTHPLAFASPSTGLQLRVEECAAGLRLRLEALSGISQTFTNGAFLHKGKLRALREHGLPFHRIEKLKEGEIYPLNQAGHVVADHLEELEKHFVLSINTSKLPQRVEVQARLEIQTEQNADRLEVLGHVVYGDPTIARILDNRLQCIDPHKVPRRYLGREKSLKRQLKEVWGLEPGFKEVLHGAAAMRFAQELKLHDHKSKISIKGLAHETFYEAGPLIPRFDPQRQDALPLYFEEQSLHGQVKNQEGKVEAGAIIQAWERQESHILLPGGGMAAIPGPWMAQHVDALRDLLASREATQTSGALPPYLLHEWSEIQRELESADLAFFREKLTHVKTSDTASQDEIDMPTCLRDYQKQGVKWLHRLGQLKLGALLADDMGLGKTLQTLSVLSSKNLVVAPTSVLGNWERESKRFRPDLKVRIYHGSQRSLEGDWQVLLTSYALLRGDIEKLCAIDWTHIVLDEAQAIKNPESLVSRSAFRLRGDARICLTGTPVENSLEDLWSQFHFLNRGLLGGRRHFIKTYHTPIAQGDETKARRLRRRIAPYLLRRMKADVNLELPPRTDMTLDVVLRDDERTFYDALRLSTRQDIAQRLGTGHDALQLLEALLRLRQSACDTTLVPGQQERAGQISSKVAMLIEHLVRGKANGHRALVFSQWTQLLNRVEMQLKKHDLDYLRLDGSTSKRQEVVDRFQDPQGPQVFLISLKAGGTGLNLTAADHVYILDPWWNPASEEQAADRAHRIGQNKAVMVYRLVSMGTVEERILHLQQHKRKLAQSALSHEAGMSKLNRNEMLSLLD
jgi:superfamily II DNA or RNA helicase